jgi:N-methylhydantoinase A
MKGKRKAYSFATHSYIDAAVYDRYRLAPGMTLGGPAIIEERESTIVLGEDATASVDAYQSVVIVFA